MKPAKMIQCSLNTIDIFTGLGCIKRKCHIHTDSKVEPVIDPPRRIPNAIRNQVQAKIDNMEEQGVIVKQHDPTPWMNSITIVRKPGKVRVCLDPNKLKKAILRSLYPVKTFEETVAEMPDAKVFSTLDAGYWQMQLDEESSKLCTFNTPWGRYRFTHLPFRVSMASDVFNETMQELFYDLDGVKIIVDDILIHTSSLEQHNSQLRAVLQRAREVGLKLHKKKSKIGLSEVQYVGHVLSKDGFKTQR